MSDAPNPPDEPQPRPRPSWGQPAPEPSESTTPLDPVRPYGWPPAGGAPPGQAPPAWSSSQPGWTQPTASQYGQDLGRHEQAYAQMYGEKPRTGMAIAAMVLGILALLASWAPVGSYVAILLALLAIVFGVVGVRRRSGRGMAIAGLVLGGIALVVAVVASIFWTRLGLEFIDIATQCEQETGRASGRAFEQCVSERSADYSPFG